MWYPLLIVLLCSLSFSTALGQRVFARVETAPLGEDLGFAVNSCPYGGDLSRGCIALAAGFPNLVFSADSSKAFVGISGRTDDRETDHVMVFDPRTGDILGLVRVALNPTQVSITPDGRKIAVVSILAGENQARITKSEPTRGVISVIDVETLEVRSAEIPEVAFSAFGNIIFSGDSRTGFVASPNTDEIVRFDVENPGETGRLKLDGGSRPVALTMSPDFSFFAAVMVGSTRRDSIKEPDAIALIDTANFSLRSEIVPETRLPAPDEDPAMFDSNLIPHDFAGVNRLAFSPDGRYGMLADQRDLTNSASVGLSPEVGTNRAWLIDFEMGKVVETFQVGGLAMGSYWAPTGEFVVVSGLSLSFIDPVTRQAERVNSPLGNFGPASVPAFSKDGKLIYLPSPLNDLLQVIDLETREVMRATTLGSTFDGGTDFRPAAPMHAAVSPDGEIIAVIDFNANQVELLRQTHRFFVPRVFANEEFFTGVAITNLNQTAIDLLATGFSDAGFLSSLQDNPTTEVVEFNNPRSIEVEAGAQFSATAAEIIEAAAGKTFTGWLDFDSNLRGLASFFLTGDGSLTRLDGSVSQARTARRVLIPEVRVTDGMITELILMNPNLNSSSVTVQLFGTKGEMLAEATQNVLRTAVQSLPLFDPEPDNAAVSGLFEDSVFENFGGGYLIVTSAPGIVALERYFDQRRMSVLNGLPLMPEEAQATRLVAPQVAAFEGSDTFFNLINVDQNQVSAEVTLRADDGSVKAGPVSVTLAPGEAIRKSVIEWFDLQAEGGLVTGWIEVTADQPGLAGDTEVQLFDGRAMTTLELQSRSAKSLIFAHVAQGAGVSTGLALLNPGSEPADVTIEVFRSDGSLVRAGQFSIGAGRRVVRLLSGDPQSQFFPDLPEQLGGYIRVTSTQELFGLEIFFSNNFEMASSVPAQLVE